MGGRNERGQPSSEPLPHCAIPSPRRPQTAPHDPRSGWNVVKGRLRAIKSFHWVWDCPLCGKMTVRRGHARSARERSLRSLIGCRRRRRAGGGRCRRETAADPSNAQFQSLVRSGLPPMALTASPVFQLQGLRKVLPAGSRHRSVPPDAMAQFGPHICLILFLHRS